MTTSADAPFFAHSSMRKFETTFVRVFIRSHTPGHRVITHRDVTDVPTFFVRMLGKLLEFTGIEYAIQDGGSPFKLAEHAQLIIFCQAA